MVSQIIPSKVKYLWHDLSLWNILDCLAFTTFYMYACFEKNLFLDILYWNTYSNKEKCDILILQYFFAIVLICDNC